MQIINLTHAEAADPAVVDTVLRLTGSGLTLIDGKTGEIQGKIAHMDRPDIGTDVAPVIPFVPPVGAVPAAPAVVDTAALFGGQPAASDVPLPPAPAASLPSAAIAPTAVLSPAAAIPGGAAEYVAPAAPAAPAPVPGAAVDSSGLPWDARIHAGNKATKQDGTWKVKKGINDPSFIPRIEAELRAAMAAPAAPAAAVPPAAPAPAVPVAPVVVPAVVAVPVTSAVPLPPAATATVAPPPSTPAPAASAAPTASPSSPLNFGTFMAKIAPFMANGKLTTEKQNEILAQFGLTTGFGGLMARPDLLPGVDATFAAVLPTL